MASLYHKTERISTTDGHIRAGLMVLFRHREDRAKTTGVDADHLQET